MIFCFIFFLFGTASIAYPTTLEEQYEQHWSHPSDINEHLPRLRELAKECASVTELGIRDATSTWGLLKGLSENQAEKRSYLGVDLILPPLNTIYLANNLADMHEISFRVWQANDFDIEIEPTDLLFIDTWHSYRHLTYELEKFSPKVAKYIAMHDTSEPWGDQDEPCYTAPLPDYPSHINTHKRGLWLAVEDFLATHPEWQLKARYFNNHGFTILERIVLKDAP